MTEGVVLFGVAVASLTPALSHMGEGADRAALVGAAAFLIPRHLRFSLGISRWSGAATTRSRRAAQCTPCDVDETLFYHSMIRLRASLGARIGHPHGFRCGGIPAQ